MPRFAQPALLALIAVVLSACGPLTEAPSDAGKILTAVEASSLNEGQTFASQRVEITGYPLLCGEGRKYPQGELVAMEVHVADSCKSATLAAIRIMLHSEGAENSSFMASGPRARNALLVRSNFSNANITFLTDDYKVIPVRTAVRVSGRVTYAEGEANAQLDAVALNFVKVAANINTAAR